MKRALPVALALGPLGAVAAGAVAQRTLYRGVELRLIALAGVALVLPILDAAARRLGAGARPWGGHPLACLGAIAVGISAVWIYPLTAAGPWLVLAWALGALFVDVPSSREKRAQDPAQRAAIGRRRAIVRRVVFALEVAVLLVLAEVALRLRGNYRSWLEANGGSYVSAYSWKNTVPWLLIDKPNDVHSLKQPEFEHEIRTNSEGLRDEEHPVDKPAGEYRIVGLGDSFVMGQGARFEDTPFRQLERSLARTPREKTCRAIAGGVAGSDPVFCYQLLERRLLKYSPDAVVLCVNGSDIGDVIARGGMDRFGPDGILKDRSGPWFEPLFVRSHLLRAYLLELEGYDWLLLPPAEKVARNAWAAGELVAAARATRELGQAHGFETLVVLTPGAQHVLDPNAPDELAPFRVALREAKVPFSDLFGFIRERVPEGKIREFFWEKDRHFTAKGYELMALGIEQDLVRLPRFPDKKAR